MLHRIHRPDRLHDLAARVRSTLGDTGEAVLIDTLLLVTRSQARLACTPLRPVADEEVPTVVPSTVLLARVLLARLHAEADDAYLAHRRLRSALDLVAATGLLRPLVDLGGEPVVGLLRAHTGGWGEHEALVARVLDRVSGPTGPVVPLTERELDVLRELPTLRTADEIADLLILSVNTVKTHLRSVYRKLGVTSRRDAIAEARRSGLL